MPNILTRPLTDKPKKLADMIADEIDNINKPQPGGDRGIVKPFMAGAVQGLGDFATDMTSPMNLGLMALGSGPMGRGLGTIGKLMSGEAKIGRTLSEGEKLFQVADEAGRNLLGPGGYAGPAEAVSSGRLTEGTAEALDKLKSMRTAVKTKIKPPRNASKKGVDF